MFFLILSESVKHETSATVKNFKTENLKRMYQRYNKHFKMAIKFAFLGLCLEFCAQS